MNPNASPGKYRRGGPITRRGLRSLIDRDLMKIQPARNQDGTPTCNVHGNVNGHASPDIANESFKPRAEHGGSRIYSVVYRYVTLLLMHLPRPT